ncbi:MAG TPA: DUF4153 domain-containing protein [Clostridiales bacterium]|nr:DUF4153 domain-containing protein [Clostridiales bacterium]
MNIKTKLNNLLSNLNISVLRYPVTILSLIILSIFNSVNIESYNDSNEFIIISLIVSAFLSLVVQSFYEKYNLENKTRWILYGASTAVSFIYYILIKQSQNDVQLYTKTLVLIFILLLLFLLIPSIKSSINYNQSFLAFFKASFLSYFYAIIILIGTYLIIAAIDTLIVSIDYTAYAHLANIIFVIFSPIYLLSLIPFYPSVSKDKIEDTNNEKLEKAIECPKFLNVLISYILIPIISIFTIILIIYLVGNIGEKFWTDTALEPMLISYSISVLIIYILASNIKNNFTKLFQMIFPKVLIPIVLLQTIASIIKINENGITYGRYYVILFGVFATIAGVLFSIIDIKKNGIVIAVLIVLATISITPPVDAFTISKSSQIRIFESVLNKNNMLENNKIIANSNISEDDKEIIRNSIQYIYYMKYYKEIEYLSDMENQYNDFENTFGFKRYFESEVSNNYYYVDKYLIENSFIDLEDYNSLAKFEIYTRESGMYENRQIIINGKTYYFDLSHINIDHTIDIREENNDLLISFKLNDLYDEEKDSSNSNKQYEMDIDEASTIFENEKIKVKIIVERLFVTLYENDKADNYKFDALLKIK